MFSNSPCHCPPSISFTFATITFSQFCSVFSRFLLVLVSRDVWLVPRAGRSDTMRLEANLVSSISVAFARRKVAPGRTIASR